MGLIFLIPQLQWVFNNFVAISTSQSSFSEFLEWIQFLFGCESTVNCRILEEDRLTRARSSRWAIVGGPFLRQVHLWPFHLCVCRPVLFLRPLIWQFMPLQPKYPSGLELWWASVVLCAHGLREDASAVLQPSPWRSGWGQGAATPSIEAFGLGKHRPLPPVLVGSRPTTTVSRALNEHKPTGPILVKFELGWLKRPTYLLATNDPLGSVCLAFLHVCVW